MLGNRVACLRQLCEHTTSAMPNIIFRSCAEGPLLDMCRSFLLRAQELSTDLPADTSMQVQLLSLQAMMSPRQTPPPMSSLSKLMIFNGQLRLNQIGRTAEGMGPFRPPLQ